MYHVHDYTVYNCVYMCIYMCIHIFMQTHTYTERHRLFKHSALLDTQICTILKEILDDLTPTNVESLYISYIKYFQLFREYFNKVFFRAVNLSTSELVGLSGFVSRLISWFVVSLKMDSSSWTQNPRVQWTTMGLR